MKKSTQLFSLIRAMSPAEKRYFKLHSAPDKGSRNYLIVFDAFDNLPDDDEQKVVEALPSDKLKRQLPFQMTYLYNSIIRSLRHFHESISAEAEVMQHLHETEILYKKGLYDLAMKAINKVVAIIDEHELYAYGMAAARWWYMVSQQDAGARKRGSYRAMREKLSSYRDQVARLERYQAILLDVRRFAQLGKKITSEQVSELETLLRSPLLREESQASSKSMKLAFYNAHALANYIKEDFQAAHKWQEKLMEISEGLAVKPHDYPSQLVNLAVYQKELLHYSDMAETLNRIEEFVDETSPSFMGSSAVMLKEFVWLMRLNSSCERGNFGEAVEYYEAIKDDVRKEKPKLDPSRYLLLRMSWAYSLFGCKRFNDSASVLANMRKSQTAAWQPDLENSWQILSLLCQIESPQVASFRLTRSSYPTYNEGRNGEEHVLRQLRGLLDTEGLSKNTKDNEILATQLEAELEKLSKNDLSIYLVDLQSWLRARTEGREFAEVVREKAQRLQQAAIEVSE